jgi:hypothetical protein
MSTKPEKINTHAGYADDKSQKLVAASLLYFGYSVFKRASIVKHFDALASASGAGKDDMDLQAQFPDVFYDALIDSIRIGLCFENYFKAKLLLAGFLVHVVDKSQNETLFRAQKIRPVETAKAIPAGTASLGSSESSILKKNTLDYELLLESVEYRKYFNVDEQIISFLEDLHKKGNRLHVYNFDKGGFGKKTLANYAALIRFVETEYTSLHNSLLKVLDPESKKRLSFK